MEIGVIGIDPIYYSSLERIGRLFFTECHLVDIEKKKPSCTLVLQLHKNHQQAYQLSLTEVTTGKEWRSPLTANPSTELPQTSLDKPMKQSLGCSLLQVLQDYTGIQQPWGVLTGVRPTKLYHRYYLEGLLPEQIEERLQSIYKVTPEKTSLLTKIVHQQQQAIPDLYDLKDSVSIYIGIPFCPTKCAYCTFPAYAISGRTGSVEAFLLALHEEIEAIGEWLREKKWTVTTIYFGGGTPTSITAKQLEKLFEKCQAAFPYYKEIREWTVEAGRPDTLEEEKLAVLKEWKVDRISINPQSFREETLKQIGRHHTVQETIEKYQLAREMGLENINMDLIIGLPNEGIDTFQRSLDVIEELRPESLTVHTLSFKRGSFLSQNKEKYQFASNDEIVKMVQLARAHTDRMGYRPYYLYRQSQILGNQENVGYALPGKESLYNILMMEERQSILGLGCGAVSKLIDPKTSKITRWANPKEPNMYIQTVQSHIKGKIDELNHLFN